MKHICKHWSCTTWYVEFWMNSCYDKNVTFISCHQPKGYLAKFRSYWFVMVSGFPLQWRHNGHDSVSNHQPHDCLLNRLFRRRSKKTSKLRVTGLCARNSLGTGEFPAQMASNAENVSISWRHHANGMNGQLERIYQAVPSVPVQRHQSVGALLYTNEGYGTVTGLSILSAWPSRIQ